MVFCKKVFLDDCTINGPFFCDIATKIQSFCTEDTHENVKIMQFIKNM